MIFNLKDISLRNYVTELYNSIMDKISDTGWVDLKLEGNTQLYTDGYNAQVRRIHNTVYFRGRVTNLAKADTIAILPEKFRPRDGYSFRFVCPCNGGTNCTVVINPNSGTMIYDFTNDGQYPANRYVSLNNIVYVND